VGQTNNKASRSSATTTTSVPNTNTDSMSVQRASKVAFASAPVLRKNTNANANGDVEPEQDENEIQTKKAKMVLGKKPVTKQVALLDVEDPDGVQVVERVSCICFFNLNFESESFDRTLLAIAANPST